ncbi:MULTISPECIES: ATP-binding cassette domain-containing protein [unclassified Imperialibacter]|uniref:ATP-binding cassette domain-containing protein n=1 Tax=unclassified Imperialibacter TaxID=2629706 RepID=UPI00125C89B6|nr:MULTISPECIES: ATP-binding cassette domain-containing protein [unclassified Imperialibacter]CAD5267541.1 ABC-2 type transport system ATP-binding protein [Imperialibacter sp. 75]CAD5279877.1 ABC-2 type transport system ATP-binding protein [Imperialibacter sp. 89]VVT01100.1 ABC-2 type transport system ATP-binding protein [Imperialibacter sp. EC-SDR9]
MSIVVENLTKKYGEQKAVNDISFKINTGEVVGFLGPNGAGKSTTMKMITCYMAPTSGDVRLDELSILNEQEDIKKKIGYLPENNPLYTDMAIVDYLRFCAEIQGVSKEKIPSRIGDMIDMCGLERERHKKINELSKGYRQRVGLAQAMIHDPEILILDEPTTGLDPNQIIEIRKLIKKLGKEKTVILSSHILSEVEATCDRILIINRGRIVADGTSDTLRSQAEGKELLTVKIEAADADVKKALLGLASVETVEPVDGKAGFFSVRSKPEVSSRKEVFDLCVSKKWYLLEMTGHETKLEDVFRELTN